MKVPFLDMKKEAEILINNVQLMDNLKDTILSGHYLFGPKLQELEDKLSEFLNSNVILVGSGTDALYLLLRAFNIGPGDKVAIPTISAIPTAIAVKMTGAECVYVEISEKTMTMDTSKLCLENISAVIPVHLYGNTADVEFISAICGCKNIPVIEDCAQSFGAKIGARYTGTIGSAGTLSFYPTKNLGCFGDGGAVVTNNINLAQEIKELRFYGQRNKYAMGNTYGMNSRMDEIQSTILLEKIKYLNTTNERRLIMLKKYKKGLMKSEINTLNTISWKVGCMPHIYPIFINNRKRFINYMTKMGIDTAIHYPFTLPAAIDKSHKKYSIADKKVMEIVSLPFNPWMSNKEIDYVIDTVLGYKE
jgi:dTDP-4-amino-4,6-dideoxygalactose transaminase